MSSLTKITVLILIFLLGVVIGSFLSPAEIPANVGENQAIPVTDREYFQTVRNLINSANFSIRMLMFDVKYYPDYPESPGNFLLLALGEAARIGVDVRIITDEYLTEKPVLSMLKENGVNIKFDSKDITTHAKLIIIDSKIVIIGSTNWSYHSIDKNHEANVLIVSTSLAKQFEGYFERIWVES